MIAINDKVYYRYRIGMFNRTKSGTVKAIKNGLATLEIPYGSDYNINVNLLTKNKVQ